MAATDAHPVRILRDLVTALEAAIALTRANPRPKPVHHLRTAARRIEAQLELLSLLPDLPPHAKPATKARKLLGKFRRAAGRVRDFDVQRNLTEPKSHEARHLRRILKHRREKEAKHLLKVIRKHQSDLVLVLETLIEALAPVEPLTLSASCLTQLTVQWYIHNTPAAAKQSCRQLHEIRKSAKLARYIAESNAPIKKHRNPKSPSSNLRLARSFESLQQSGGTWHDWLTLSGIARRELGSTSPLAQSFAHRCRKSLTDYQRILKSLQKNIVKVLPSKA